MGLIAPPLDIDDVARQLAAASAEGRPVEVAGGGHHAGRGAPVSAREVVRAPGGVVAHEPADLTCTVGGGCTLDELHGVIGRARQELPTTGIPGSATVGGVLAAGVSPRRRLREGPLRDRVLQVRLVTGDGRVVKGGGPTVKNVSGYDLCRLACGSLGTLGVIAEVILKVTPRPPSSVWWSAETGSVEEAVDLGEAAFSALYDPAAVEVVGPPWRVQVLLEGHAADVAAQAARLPGAFASVDEPVTPDDEVLEAAVPPASLRVLVDGRRPARLQLGVGLAWFPTGDDAVALRAAAEACGGRLHTLRPVPGVDPFGSAPVGVEVMRRIRRSFDPAAILNRGRIPFLDPPPGS